MNSELCNRFRNGNFGNDCVIVADSAYPPDRFICKPLPAPQTANEMRYQRSQIKARNVAERLNGQLKKEFPIMKYGIIYSLLIFIIIVCLC